MGDARGKPLAFDCIFYCAAYQRSAICDEFGESAGCSCLIG